MTKEAEKTNDVLLTEVEKQILRDYFGEIAFCLSGGGFRAAAFHCGAFLMLEELGLTDNIKNLSTASGGTIVGAFFALRRFQAEEKSQTDFFSGFFKDFYRLLDETNVIDEALQQIYETRSPSGKKDLSLIRAAAEIYRAKFFGNTTFGDLCKIVDEKRIFSELIFNTTEFRAGNGFRFRLSHNPNAFVGNKNLKVERECAKDILLADVVAASQCFPGAFEPMVFPDDFRFKSNKFKTMPLETVFSQQNAAPFVSVPLMDGGIYDNQGVEGIFLADELETSNIGLFIVSDSDRRDDNFLAYEQTNRAGKVSLEWWWIALLIVFIFAGTSSLFIIYKLSQSSPAQSFGGILNSIFTSFVPLGLCLFVVGFLIYLTYLFYRYKNIKFGSANFQIWKFIKFLTIPDLIGLLKNRANSTLTMTSNIFLKRIRQLLRNAFFADTSRRHRLTLNLLYDLNPTTTRAKMPHHDKDLLPNCKSKNYSVLAEEVPTTLWLDREKEELKNLIICGQLSMCFSLVRFVFRKQKIQSPKGRELYKKGLQELEKLRNSLDFTEQEKQNLKQYEEDVFGFSLFDKLIDRIEQGEISDNAGTAKVLDILAKVWLDLQENPTVSFDKYLKNS